jgi:small-conductance mechanosensitive channel
VAFLNDSFGTTLATAATALLSLSFVFASTAAEILGSCIFLFVKHPYDVGDRCDVDNAARKLSDKLVVEHIALLYTVFKRVADNKIVQIPNSVLNVSWIENISRSKAMKEKFSIWIPFDTPFEHIDSLKTEMKKFLLDRENAREFQPDIMVEVLSTAKLSEIEVGIEIRHKVCKVKRFIMCSSE